MKPSFGIVLAFCGILGVAASMAAEAEKDPGERRFTNPTHLPETGRTSPNLAPLDDLMRSFVKSHDIPGATLAVAKGGRVLYARGFGYADVKGQISVQPDSLFRIGSVSKPITAIAILHLVERRKLKIHDRVLDLVKFRPASGAAEPADARWREITVLELLQHTGGFDRGRSGDPMFRSVDIARELQVTPPARPEAVIRHMLGRSLDFDPGTREAYSNFGYCLLGRVVEAVAEMPYETYVRDEILRPIGVTRMRIGATREKDRCEGEVHYYTRDGRRSESVFQSDLGSSVPVQYGGWCLESMDAHGGWIASAIDLVRLASAIDDDAQPRILSARAVKAMFAPPAPPVARDDSGNLAAAYYACGWMVRPVAGTGRANTWHLGELAGTSTLLVRRHDGFTWAALFNIERAGDSKSPAELIDPLIHGAVDRVRRWPPGNAGR